MATEEEIVINQVLRSSDHFETLGFGKYNINLKIPTNSELRKAYFQ